MCDRESTRENSGGIAGVCPCFLLLADAVLHSAGMVPAEIPGASAPGTAVFLLVYRTAWPCGSGKISVSGHGDSAVFPVPAEDPAQQQLE